MIASLLCFLSFLALRPLLADEAANIVYAAGAARSPDAVTLAPRSA